MPKVITNAMSSRNLDAPGPTGFKAKIRVPRLDGGKMGVLATRTPHRPAPIGLSVAKVRPVVVECVHVYRIWRALHVWRVAVWPMSNPNSTTTPNPAQSKSNQILGVEGNRLILGGADIVDGSPVLDIKPYVPFCDSVPDAVAPAWVQVGARMRGVCMEVCMRHAAPQRACMLHQQAACTQL